MWGQVSGGGHIGEGEAYERAGDSTASPDEEGDQDGDADAGLADWWWQCGEEKMGKE